MKNVEDIWMGWLEARIADLVEDLPELITDFPYVLITSIDSSQDLRTLKNIEKIIQEIEDCKFLDEALEITGKEFPKLLNSYNILNEFDLFNGFDEIWLFRSSPPVKKPSKIWITAPLQIISDIPEGLAEWMMNSGCSLGLGDGIGLNYITTEKGIADLLEEKYKIKITQH